MGTTASYTATLDITEMERCDWIEESERQLTVRLDDPLNGFEMAPITVDLLEFGDQALSLPVTFIPTAAQDYEAQLLFEMSDNPEVAQARPKSYQLFGEVQPTE